MALTDLLKGARKAALGLALAVNTGYGCGGSPEELADVNGPWCSIPVSSPPECKNDDGDDPTPWRIYLEFQQFQERLTAHLYLGGYGYHEHYIGFGEVEGRKVTFSYTCGECYPVNEYNLKLIKPNVLSGRVTVTDDSGNKFSGGPEEVFYRVVGF